MLLVAMAVLVAHQSSGAPAQPTMRAHFINVGQAAMTLLEFPCGAVLIDAGSQGGQYTQDAVNYLTRFFAGRPDLNNSLEEVIITHNHTDHTRALKTVAQHFTIKRFFDNGDLTLGGSDNPQWLRAEVAAGHSACKIRAVRQSDISTLPQKTGLTDGDIDPLACATCDPKIVLLKGRHSTNPGWSAADFNEPNNHSIVIRVDFGSSSFLVTGDLEERAILDLLNFYDGTPMLDVDVYLAGHHGSANGTTDDFLLAITPERAVISCGPATGGCGGQTAMKYGHPAWRTLDSLEKVIKFNRSPAIFPKVANGSCNFGTRKVKRRIYGTPWDGNIVITAKLDGTMTTTIK